MKVKGCQKAFVQLLNYVLVCFSYVPEYDPSLAGRCAHSGISPVYSDCQDFEVQGGMVELASFPSTKINIVTSCPTPVTSSSTGYPRPVCHWTSPSGSQTPSFRGYPPAATQRYRECIFIKLGR